MTAAVATQLHKPYVTPYAEETLDLPLAFERAAGSLQLTYRDALPQERMFGALWARCGIAREGKIQWHQVHTLRQRRCMLKRLCRVRRAGHRPRHRAHFLDPALRIGRWPPAGQVHGSPAHVQGAPRRGAGHLPTPTPRNAGRLHGRRLLPDRRTGQPVRRGQRRPTGGDLPSGPHRPRRVPPPQPGARHTADRPHRGPPARAASGRLRLPGRALLPRLRSTPPRPRPTGA